MGQYYRIVNLSKQQYLSPWTFGDGAKLLEFGASASGTMAGLAILLANGNNRGGGDLRSDHPLIGSWAGDTIVIAGDYADGGLFLPTDVSQAELEAVASASYTRSYAKPENVTLYHYAEEKFEDISHQVLEALAHDPYLRRDLTVRTAWQDDAELDRILGQDRKERARAMEQEQAVYLRPDQVVTLKHG